MSPRRITLSTAGIIPKIAELGREPVRPKLAISLNASTEEQRRELMPITRKYPLKDLLAACKAYPLRPWEKLTFEYVLLKGVNDSGCRCAARGKAAGASERESEFDRAESGAGDSIRDAGSGARARVSGDRAAVDAVLYPQAARAGYFRGVRAVEETAIGSWRLAIGGERYRISVRMEQAPNCSRGHNQTDCAYPQNVTEGICVS